MQFGTKSVKIRRCVQRCFLSVHNVTFILGSDDTICGHLNFVRFRVLFLVYGLLGLCCVQWVICVTVRGQYVSPKRRNIHLLYSAEMHKRDQRSDFVEFLLRIANLHTTLHAQLFRAVCVNVYRSDRGLEWSA
jgi:hypothetical protein